MKLLKWFAWLLMGTASVIILLGIIAILNPNELFLGFRQTVNFFHAASTLLLLAIAIMLATWKNDS